MSISSVKRMTSLSPVNRKNYWKEKSNPSSSSSCENEGLSFLRRRLSLRTWSTALIFSGQNVRRYPNGKTVAITPSKKNVGTFLKGIRRINQRRTWLVCRRFDRSTQPQDSWLGELSSARGE